MCVRAMYVEWFLLMHNAFASWQDLNEEQVVVMVVKKQLKSLGNCNCATFGVYPLS